MPRPKNAAPVLKLRKARTDKLGRITHNAGWYIYDDGKQVTRAEKWGIDLRGVSPDDRPTAERVCKAYIARKYAEELTRPQTKKRAPPDETLIADVISYYAQKNAAGYEPSEANPRGKPAQLRDFLFRMEALLAYWGGRFVDDIDMETCAEFAEHVHLDPDRPEKPGKRLAPSVVRRCLEDLRAAVKLYVKARRMASGGDYVFDLPPPNPPRYGFFTRSQIARLVWAAYRKKRTYSYTGKRARPENRGKTVETSARPRRHIARFLLTAVATGTRTERIERASFYQEPGRPWIDVDGGIFYRAWDGEFVPDNKGADPIRLPKRLVAHMRRWKRNGARYLIEHQEGKSGSTASAFFRLLREVLSEAEIAAMDLNRHALKHTCATWLMMAGMPMGEIAGYLSTSEKTIRRHYGHHHPDHQQGVGNAFTTGSAGRASFGREARSPEKPTAANNPAVAAEARRAVRELLELFEAPVVLFGVLSATPDAGLEEVREAVKRCARTGDWTTLLSTDIG